MAAGRIPLSAFGLLAGLLAVSACTRPEQPVLSPTVQGWTAEERMAWYQATQGSRLIPLDWLNALEQPDSEQPFLADEHIRRFRYIPAVTDAGLPLGFAVDDQPDDRLAISRLRWKQGQSLTEKWVGMNCAACHTGQIAYRGRSLRIEGGQALADFDGFVRALDRAVGQTQQDPARFDRFARAVLRAEDNAENRSLLAASLARWKTWQDNQARANATPVEAGFGRVDAFGHIFNKVAQVVVPSAPGNPPTAPVSYPFLWNIHRLPFVQYNAIAANGPRIGHGRGTLDLGAAARNAGEVIGVFADVSIEMPDPRRKGDQPRVVTSLQLGSQIGLEQQLMRLQPPAWPAIFPPIDQQKARAGAVLFAAQCASCHVSPTTLVAGRFPARISMFNDASKTPATQDNTPNVRPGTDPAMACNAFAYRSVTGPLRGRPANYLSGKPLEETAAVADILKYVVAGALLDQSLAIDLRILGQSWIGWPQLPRVAGLSAAAAPARGRPGAIPAIPPAPPSVPAAGDACLTAVNTLLGYKSRPLDGVWATAPYLHNGSVPNLYELLLPPERRSPSFPLGTREYDVRNVGYSTDPKDPENRWTFVAREGGVARPGNDNAGHDYGNARLSDEDRYAIIEYLKTL